MSDTRKNYQWTGINAAGKRKSGVIEANASKDAQLELQKLGIEVITLTAKKGFEGIKFNFFSRKKKVKTKDILFFTRYLSSMLSAGLSLVQALDIISRDKENTTLNSMVLEIKSSVSGGKTLSESFALFPKQFNNFYCNLIKAGEKSGTLDIILKRLGNYLEKTATLKKKVKKALVYPMAIVTIAMIVSAVLLIFVVPQFDTMFTSLGAQLPAFTRYVVHLSDFLRSYWWIVLIAGVISTWLVKHMLAKSEKLREFRDSWILRLVIVGPILKKGIIARYTRTLGTTLESGMPIVEAMKSIAGIMENSNYKKAVLKICDDVTSGQALSTSMANTNLFPNMAVQMIAVGEASGSLSDMLNKVAEYYEDEVDNIVDNLSSLLEPIIMLFLGVIVGTFVVAMYLPIFKMGSLF